MPWPLQIPALVSLKKLSAVSFAGVDTLDDVKNHTYNELFVSGGFIVSDEFVLNPDLISQGTLGCLWISDGAKPSQIMTGNQQYRVNGDDEWE